jgi:hypothetical protein
MAETAPERNEVLMSCVLMSTEGAARRAAFMKITDWMMMTPNTPATQIHRTGLLAMAMMSAESLASRLKCQGLVHGNLRCWPLASPHPDHAVWYVALGANPAHRPDRPVGYQHLSYEPDHTQ